MPDMSQYSKAALKLHNYLVVNHLENGELIGPDPGVRFNYRIWRFIKSYFRHISWDDQYYYLQCQGYWALANCLLFEQTADRMFLNIAANCSNRMIERQRKDGAWEYPNPEWAGRIANAEGTWGALGLVETYRQTAETIFLNCVLNWHRFMVTDIGFQQCGDELAVNYFANRQGMRVPNNTAFVLRFFAELADITGDENYRDPCGGLLKFMQNIQKPTGEWPYAVRNEASSKEVAHFQCFQYNAFQCLDLMRYYSLTGDKTVLPLIANVLIFLRRGIAADGHVRYQCENRYRQVVYHTAVVGAAFDHAKRIGIDGYDHLADRAYTYLLGLQKPDGRFHYSRGDYRLLCDRRSYPRYLAMILYHLLLKAIGPPLNLKER
jgi:hypothetical protein